MERQERENGILEDERIPDGWWGLRVFFCLKFFSRGEFLMSRIMFAECLYFLVYSLILQ